jgi:hypothetical protein
MRKTFSFFSLTYFFKQLLFCNVKQQKGLYYLAGLQKLPFYTFFQTLYSTLLVYKMFLATQSQVFLLSSAGVGRYNYQLFQYTNYYLNPRLDPREYTTRISTLARRPYLNLFGTMKMSSGLYLNLSQHGALVLRHLSKTQNVAASVALAAPLKLFQVDYSLSFKNTLINEKYYFQLLITLADNQSLMTKVSQHFLYYRNYRQTVKPVKF